MTIELIECATANRLREPWRDIHMVRRVPDGEIGPRSRIIVAAIIGVSAYR